MQIWKMEKVKFLKQKIEIPTKNKIHNKKINWQANLTSDTDHLYFGKLLKKTEIFKPWNSKIYKLQYFHY